jgi:hypothetical protein
MSTRTGKPEGMSLFYRIASESTAVTSGGASPDPIASFDRYPTLLANTLAAETIIEGDFIVFCTDGANGATCTIELRLGGTGGGIIVTSGSIDPATNDWVQGHYSIEILTTGGGGTFNAIGTIVNQLASGVTSSVSFTRAGAIDTTANKDLMVCITWSGTAGDDALLGYFTTKVMP